MSLVFFRPSSRRSLLLHRPTSFFFPDGEFCVAIGENSIRRFLCEGTRLVFANDVECVDDAGDVLDLC